MFSNDDVEARLTQFYQHALADTFIQVSDVEAVAGGWEAWLYRYTLHTEDASPQALVLRLFHGDNDGKAQHEFNAMRGLKRLNYPVPSVYHLTSYEESLFEASHFMMDFVEGRLLGQVIIEGATINADLLVGYCRLMADLHGLEWESEFRTALDVDDPYGAIDDYLEEAHLSIQQAALADFGPLVEWMEMRRDAVPCARLSLTHNDFHTENILVEDDGRMVVIDWPNFRISDYRFDLGWSLMLAGTFASRAASDAVLQTYEAVRGAPVAHIDVFIVAAIGRRLSDLAVTVKGSAAERGMRPDAVNNMRHVADHFEACYGWLVEITGVRLAGIEDLLANLGE